MCIVKEYMFMNSILEQKEYGEKLKKNERIYYLDVLRCLACLLVVITHCSSGHLLKDYDSLNFWIGNVLASLARIGVPLFVMISGARLLDENYNCSMKKIVHKTLRLVTLFCFWSVCYCVTYQIIPTIAKGEALSIITVKSLLKGPEHFWYIIMLIGLYLIVPLLRLWVKKDNKKGIEYFLVLSTIITFLIPKIIEIVSCFLPIAKDAEYYLGTMNLSYVGGYTSYFILGWYLNNFAVPYKKTIISVGIIGILISIFGTYGLSVYTGEVYRWYDYISAHVMAYSIMVFMVVKDKYSNFSQEQASSKKISVKAVNTIAKNSLGIYAIHPLVIFAIDNLWAKIGLYENLVIVPADFIISMVLCLLATVIIRKIRIPVV